MEECRTFFSKFRGLMFSKPKNLVFVLNKETRFGAIIHTFFVFYPINVYWLNANKDIVDFCFEIKPFRIKIPKKKCKYIIELKKGFYLDNPRIPSTTTIPPRTHAK